MNIPKLDAARITAQLSLLTEFAAKSGLSLESLLSVPADDVADELSHNAGCRTGDLPDGALELLTIQYGSFSVCEDGLCWSLGYASRVFSDGEWSGFDDDDDVESDDDEFED